MAKYIKLNKKNFLPGQPGTHLKLLLPALANPIFLAGNSSSLTPFGTLPENNIMPLNNLIQSSTLFFYSFIIKLAMIVALAAETSILFNYSASMKLYG